MDRIKKAHDKLSENLMFFIAFYILINLATLACGFIPIVGSICAIVPAYYLSQVYLESNNLNLDFSSLPSINFLAYIKMIGLGFLTMLPLCAILIGAVIFSFFMIFQGSIESVFILLVALFALVFIYLIIFTLFFGFSGLILLDKDFSTVGIFESLKLSAKMLKGNKIKYISVGLWALLVSFVSILTFGIAFIYTLPLISMMNIQFYLECKSQLV